MLLGILVRDLHAELLLEAHDELDQVQRIGVEVFDERGLGRDLLLVNAELLDDDLLESFEGGSVGHAFWLLHPMAGNASENAVHEAAGCVSGVDPGEGYGIAHRLPARGRGGV